MPEIGVVHLVRAKNGIEAFNKFIESYAKNQGGIEHDLIVIFKGFDSKKDREKLEEYHRLLQGYNYKFFYVRDFGYDIIPYFAAVKKYDYKYFCFLNSFSIILDKEWLKKMYGYIIQEDVGLVGATGSYQSMHSDWISISKISRYRKYAKTLQKPWYRQIGAITFLKLFKPFFMTYFDAFPNYHIRTNGFIIAKEIMEKVRHNLILTKWDAYKFESGKNSLTNQILKMSLKVLVVGKDGKSYEIEDWPRSNTYHQGDQSNLLITDKTTNEYLYAPLERKQEIYKMAWGDIAYLDLPLR